MPKSTKESKNNKNNQDIEEEIGGEEALTDEQEVFEEEYGKILALWEFPEFIKHERSKVWYISFTVVFLAMLAYSYMTDNLLFAIILVIFAVLYLTSAKDEPKTMETALTEDGIFIGPKFIPYEDIQNFYIIYYPPEIKNLYLEPKNMLKPRIVIPLERQHPVHIREILLEYLEEDVAKEEIPASESISKILKL